MAGYEITDTFSEPFNQSVASLPSYFSPSIIGLAGVPYLIDTREGTTYRRQSFDVVQQKNTTDARDLLLLPADVWRQQAQSWHLGSGQTNLDREDALIYRYNTSYGIDPWTEFRLSLLPTTSLLGGTSALNGDTWLQISKDGGTSYLVVGNGSRAYWYSNLSTTATSVGSGQISGVNTIVDMHGDGHKIFALMSDRFVWTVTGPSATPAKWANHQYTANISFLAYEKGFLLVGDGNLFYNALKGNNPALVFTHPDTDFRWYSAASGPSAIYALGRLGDQTTIHKVTIKSTGTELNPCIVAATLPDGEIGYEVSSYLGFILIGTNKGVRVAVPDSNGDLTLGSIIPSTQPVRCFEGQDRFVWFGNEAVDGFYSATRDTDIFPTGTVSGLSRMDLSRTTINALTPAYATDMVAETVTGVQVQAVATFQNKRVFSLGNGDVWFEGSSLMKGGWLTQGVISYSVEDQKTGLYMQTKWEPLNGSVALDVSYDSYGYTRVSDFTIQNSIRSGNVGMNGVQFSRMEPRFVLKRSDGDATLGPKLTRWEVRSIPVRGRNTRWTLPIMNYEDIEIDQVEYTRDPLAVLNALLSLSESGELFSLRESGVSYTVHAKEYVWQPEKLTLNGKSWQGIFTLVVEEVA